MIIEIAAIRPPKEGKQVATVVAGTGESFEIWPDKASRLQAGGRYEIEIEVREWKGRSIRKIVKAQPAKDGAQICASSPSAKDGAQAFLASVLCAFIAAGKVGLDADEIAAAIDTVRAGCRRARQMNGGGHAEH